MPPIPTPGPDTRAGRFGTPDNDPSPATMMAKSLLPQGMRVRWRLTGQTGVVMPYEPRYALNLFPVKCDDGVWHLLAERDVDVLGALSGGARNYLELRDLRAPELLAPRGGGGRPVTRAGRRRARNTPGRSSSGRRLNHAIAYEHR